VAPGCIKAHQCEYHGEQDLPTRQNIVEHVKRLQLPHPADVGKPPDRGQALPELELHHGYQCKWPGCREQYHICNNRATQLAQQRQHHAGQQAHFGRCLFQSFFASQAALYYFVVQPPLDEAEAADAPIAAAAAAAAAPHAPPLSDWQRQWADDDQAQRSGAYARIAPAVHVLESDPWLRITGFPQHLMGVDACLAQELYVPPV
jgi:hypothetical protein